MSCRWLIRSPRRRSLWAGAGPDPPHSRRDDGVAIVPLGPGDGVAVVDLRDLQLMRVIPLPGSGANGAAVVDDSIAYVANPNLNTVSRINYLTGESAEVPVGQHPQGVVFARGRVFVLNGNLDETLEPSGESWITVIDPVTNLHATGIDSIPLSGPGNARSGAVGGDGLLYVVSRRQHAGRAMDACPSSTRSSEWRSRASPVSGRAPGQVATDRLTRRSSSARPRKGCSSSTPTATRSSGARVRECRSRRNTGVAVDSEQPGVRRGGRLLRRHRQRDSRTCSTADLSEVLRTLPLGSCSAAALTVRIPPE